MEFGLSEDQRLLQESVGRFLDGASALERVRLAADGDASVRAEIAAGLNELGLAGIMVPEAQGGAGLGLLEAALVQEQLGRHTAPAGFMAQAALASIALQNAGSEAQQAEWLPKLVSGEARFGIAVSEAAGAREKAGVTAGPDGLAGKALFALEPDRATHFIAADRDRGLHLVARDAAGLAVRPMPTIDRTRPVAELVFDGVRAEALTGGNDASATVQRMIAAGRVLLAADSFGAAERMIEKAVDYAKEREQFGRTIGSFQAVKHMCAEMAARLEPCRSLIWYAAHADTAEPGEFPLMAALAKSHMAEVGTFVARTATEVHGGMGFTDLMGLHYWFKRIGLNRQLLGGPEAVRADAARLQGFDRAAG
ncbi:acyl-CoA dehydrogenase family protein [Minwuia thermotolerans]|uniref:Acyl-CoA dehydrogenase n=1 Tax=Minwuia thermotolerans TaxID=2056226 RepID=A0A2M9G147_9PROT|nr:acyl-CoA dehydrogenase family protein [Minwuia thermotolerans]PJK29426.1 acyl-CoA dehydrogenase [Minwuia thermotolerans]